MDLRHLLQDQGIEPQTTLVLRHTPADTRFARVMPWLAAERQDLFNAYQSQQSPRVEKAMLKSSHVASFIGQKGARALFVGVYLIEGSKPLKRRIVENIPEMIELERLGETGFSKDPRDVFAWFDLKLTTILAEWRGKLVIGWPDPQILWYRSLAKAFMPVRAIHEESVFARSLPDWHDLDLGWADLKVLPSNLRGALAQWRGIYFIYDMTIGKGYVGSAAGAANLLGRWENYAASGHGGNRLLRERDPSNFRFSILQRVSPDMDKDDVVRTEATWKERLHTRAPYGLNDN